MPPIDPSILAALLGIGPDVRQTTGTTNYIQDLEQITGVPLNVLIPLLTGTFDTTTAFMPEQTGVQRFELPQTPMLDAYLSPTAVGSPEYDIAELIAAGDSPSQAVAVVQEAHRLDDDAVDRYRKLAEDLFKERAEFVAAEARMPRDEQGNIVTEVPEYRPSALARELQELGLRVDPYTPEEFDSPMRRVEGNRYNQLRQDVDRANALVRQLSFVPEPNSRPTPLLPPGATAPRSQPTPRPRQEPSPNAFNVMESPENLPMMNVGQWGANPARTVTYPGGLVVDPQSNSPERVAAFEESLAPMRNEAREKRAWEQRRQQRNELRDAKRQQTYARNALQTAEMSNAADMAYRKRMAELMNEHEPPLQTALLRRLAGVRALGL